MGPQLHVSFRMVDNDNLAILKAKVHNYTKIYRSRDIGLGGGSNPPISKKPEVNELKYSTIETYPA